MTFEEWLSSIRIKPAGENALARLAWNAAYIEGQKAMREMAAKKSEVHICDNNCSDRGNGTCCEFVIAESIRALPIEGE